MRKAPNKFSDRLSISPDQVTNDPGCTNIDGTYLEFGQERTHSCCIQVVTSMDDRDEPDNNCVLRLEKLILSFNTHDELTERNVALEAQCCALKTSLAQADREKVVLVSALKDIIDAKAARDSYPGDGWRLAHDKFAAFAQSALARVYS